MLKVLSATQPIRVFLADETDGITGLTGLTITVYLCKPGESSFTNVTATTTETELGNGWYEITPTGGLRNTAGENIWHVEATGAIPADVKELVGADWVYETVSSNHSTAGTFGQDIEDILAAAEGNSTTLTNLGDQVAAVDAVVDAILVDTGTSIPLTLLAIEGKVDTVDGVVDAIALDTNELQTDWANGGRLDLIVDAIKAVTDALPDAGALTSIAQASNLATVDTVVDGIQADLDNATDGLGALKALIDDLNDLSAADVATELATYDGPTKAEMDAGFAGLNDPTAAAIADAVLDELLAGHTTAGSLGKVVADILEDSGTSIPALIAALNNLSAAEVNAEVDTALAEYDAPTKAELDAGFAALNDLSAAQVNAEVDTALVDYDAPTKAELDAGFAGLNDPTAGAIADAVWTESIADHSGTAGSTAEALDGAVAPTAADVADAVWEEAIADHSGTSGSTAEALANVTAAGGANTVTITVDDTDDNLIANATVQIISNGTIIDQATTNVSGVATLSADNGTYTLIVVAGGFSSSINSSFVVSGDTASAVELSQHTIATSNPGFVTGYYHHYVDGVVSVGEPVTIKAVKRPTSGANATGIIDERNETKTTASGGLVQFTNLTPGVTYIVTAAGTTVKTTIPGDATGSVALNTIVGDGE